MPSERKLLYIEPSIDSFSGDEPFNDVVSVVSSALSLPAREGIRADLDTIARRNRQLKRVTWATGRILSDLAEPKVGAERHQEGGDWANMWLSDAIEIFGPGYGTYHRLKVDKVVDWFATVLASAAGADRTKVSKQDLSLAIFRWRDARYFANEADVPHPVSPPPHRPTQSRFLLYFDVSFRVRRVAFLTRVISGLLTPDDKWGEDMAQQLEIGVEQDRSALVAALAQLSRLARDLTFLERVPWSKWPVEVSYGRKVPDDLARRAAGLFRLLESATLESDAIERVLNDLANMLDEKLEIVFKDAALQCGKVLEGLGLEKLTKLYQEYETADMVLFPILDCLETSSLDQVAVHRIAPLDSQLRWSPDGPKKLAGSRHMHFGAFLQRDWRESDITWGRLDGATQLIQIICDGRNETALVEEARRIIVGGPRGGSDVATATTDPLELQPLEAEAVVQMLHRTTPVVDKLIGGLNDKKSPVLAFLVLQIRLFWVVTTLALDSVLGSTVRRFIGGACLALALLAPVAFILEENRILVLILGILAVILALRYAAHRLRAGLRGQPSRLRKVGLVFFGGLLLGTLLLGLFQAAEIACEYFPDAPGCRVIEEIS